ncbi:MAG: hypothetical protein FWC10_00730 [Lentimicrobiaceae bacterium]|nr:hypothetical protein [Lentimicrobiaceae bacterium]
MKGKKNQNSNDREYLLSVVKVHEPNIGKESGAADIIIKYVKTVQNALNIDLTDQYQIKPNSFTQQEKTSAKTKLREKYTHAEHLFSYFEVSTNSATWTQFNQKMPQQRRNILEDFRMHGSYTALLNSYEKNNTKAQSTQTIEEVAKESQIRLKIDHDQPIPVKIEDPIKVELTNLAPPPQVNVNQQVNVEAPKILQQQQINVQPQINVEAPKIEVNPQIHQQVHVQPQVDIHVQIQPPTPEPVKEPQAGVGLRIDIEQYSKSTCEKFLQINAKKYRRDCFAGREEFTLKYNNFTTQDKHNFFLILGESGIGKTNFICNIVEKEISNNSLVFSYDSSGLSKESIKGIASLLPTIQKGIEKSPEKKIVFLFDAINEATNYCSPDESDESVPYLELLKDIDTTISKNYPDFKVIISCRLFSWDDVLKDKISRFSFKYDSKETFVELREFTEHEFKSVYPLYKAKHNLQTEIEEINTLAYATLRKELLNPLQLRWVADVYENQVLPQTADELNYEHLCRKKIKQLEKTDRTVKELIHRISRHLISRKAHVLNDSDLFYDENLKDTNLKRILELFKVKVSSEYTTAGRLLIDANFLKKVDNGFRFEFDRIQEAMFAHVFVDDMSRERYTNELIPVHEFMSVYNSMEHDVVYNNFLRDALIKDFKQKREKYTSIWELAVTDDPNMQKLAYHTLSKLMHKHYNAVYEIIDEIIDHEAFLGFASKTTMELITDLFIPSVYEQSVGNANQPVTLLQKIMLNAGKNKEITNRLSLNTYVITRRNKERADEIIKELFKYALESEQLSIEYLFQLGTLSLVLSIDILTQSTEADKEKNLEFVRKNILNNWKTLANRMFSTKKTEAKKLKITGPGPKLLWSIFNRIPLFIRNKILKFVIKVGLLKFGHVQGDYVNNLAEFKRFWKDIPKKDSKGAWSQKDYSYLTSYLDPQKGDIQEQKKVILEGYKLNNAFSYFLLERVLIVQGISNWNNVSVIIEDILNLEELTDYNKMSVAYVLFHIIEKSEKFSKQAFQNLSKITKDWISSTKGSFSIITHGEHGKKYKQFVLNWYLVAYFKWHDYRDIDWKDVASVEQKLPVFVQLVNEALTNHDKDLLFCIIENICKVATDFGYTDTRYIEVATRLFDFVVNSIDTDDRLSLFKSASDEKDLPDFMCETLNTMQSYFPVEVKGYLDADLNFSNSILAQRIIEKMRLADSVSETLGDLLTHRTGNFIVWVCRDFPAGRNLLMDLLKNAENVNNQRQWAFKTAEKCMLKLTGIKL